MVGQELEKGNMAQKKVEKKPPVVWREFTESNRIPITRGCIATTRLNGWRIVKQY